MKKEPEITYIQIGTFKELKTFVDKLIIFEENQRTRGFIGDWYSHVRNQ